MDEFDPYGLPIETSPQDQFGHRESGGENPVQFPLDLGPDVLGPLLRHPRRHRQPTL